MEAILLDLVPAGTANQALSAGNASAPSSVKSPFASLLASSGDDTARDGAMDGRAAGDASAAAALLALLFPQPAGLPQAIAAADLEATDPTAIGPTAVGPAAIGLGATGPTATGLGATGLEAMGLDPSGGDPAGLDLSAPEAIGRSRQSAPNGLALALNDLAPGQNDLETVPGKTAGLASGTPGIADDQLLPSFKQGRDDAPAATTGLAKTVSLAAAQAQPATSTPLPPELIESAIGEGDKLKLSASKANATPAAAPTPPAEDAAPAFAEATDASKPVAEAPPPIKPALPQLDDQPVDARRDEDIDGPAGLATGSIDRPHGLGATSAPHTAVEKLANLIQHPELLAAHIERAAASGRDRISIALVPADLGRIDISLDFDRGGKISAVIAADRPQTLELLQRDQRGLERALQDAGFKTDSGSLSFNLRGDQRQQQNPSAPWASTRPAAEPWLAANRPLPQQAALARLVADGRLDIEV